VLRRTATGVRIFALGNDEYAARARGIPVRRVKTIAYALAGTLAAASGLFLAATNLIGFFFSHPEELRTATALDVSRTYLRDAAQDRSSVLLLIKAQDPNPSTKLSDVELEKLRSQADTLEFYARLAEDKKLDPDYLSDALVCAIIFAADAAQKYNLSIPTSGKPLALRSFASKHTCKAGRLLP